MTQRIEKNIKVSSLTKHRISKENKTQMKANIKMPKILSIDYKTQKFEDAT